MSKDGDEGVEMKPFVMSGDPFQGKECLTTACSETTPANETKSTLMPVGSRKECFTTESSPAVPIHTLSYARQLLYLSLFFAHFSEIVWKFSVAIFLSACTNYQSLILVSTFGLALSISVCAAGASLGDWIDHTNRLHVARRAIALENIALTMGILCCSLLLSSPQATASVIQTQDEESLSWMKQRFSSVPQNTSAVLALMGIHIFGSIAKVLHQTFLVAMERDWVVVLSQASGEQRWLSITTVAMRRIDLCCRVVANGVAGFIISKIGNLQWACLIVGGLRCLALVVEYWCATKIYTLISALSFPKESARQQLNSDESSSLSEEQIISTPFSKFSCPSWLPDSLRVYLEQPSSPGGLGLALLYSNTMTFGNGILTTYLLFRGMPMQLVGILRGIASAVGLLGTVAYSYSVLFFSLETTACWGVTYQSVCLAVALAAVNARHSSISLSRIGLWVFDIAITQIQQQEIPEHIRGLVGGVQRALNSFCNILSFGLGFLFPDPHDFPYFVSCGFASVFLAMVFFSVGICIPRRLVRTRRYIDFEVFPVHGGSCDSSEVLGEENEL